MPRILNRLLIVLLAICPVARSASFDATIHVERATGLASVFAGADGHALIQVDEQRGLLAGELLGASQGGQRIPLPAGTTYRFTNVPVRISTNEMAMDRWTDYAGETTQRWGWARFSARSAGGQLQLQSTGEVSGLTIVLSGRGVRLPDPPAPPPPPVVTNKPPAPPVVTNQPPAPGVAADQFSIAGSHAYYKGGDEGSFGDLPITKRMYSASTGRGLVRVTYERLTGWRVDKGDKTVDGHFCIAFEQDGVLIAGRFDHKGVGQTVKTLGNIIPEDPKDKPILRHGGRYYMPKKGQRVAFFFIDRTMKQRTNTIVTEWK